MKAAILPILALLFLLFGCEEDRGTRTSHSTGGNRLPEPVVHQEPTRVFVTSDDASFPDGCHPRQVAGLVISFVNAFNSGDQASLSRIFSCPRAPVPLTSRRGATIRGHGTP